MLAPGKLPHRMATTVCQYGPGGTISDGSQCGNRPGRSAAPDAISRDATVLVLGRHGYETAVEDKNGWVCMVERGMDGDLR